MMLKLWKWYQNCLTVHPVKTQVISSGVIWAFGDVAAQSVTHFTAPNHRLTSSLRDKEEDAKINWRRVATTSLFGFGFVGPVGHFWNFLSVYCAWSLGIDPFKFFPEADQTHICEGGMNNIYMGPEFGRGYMYEGLDRFMKTRLQLQPRSLRFVGYKVALDGIIFGPLDLLVFFTYMGFSVGKSTTQVKEDVKRDFLPALILEGGIWPILQVANFRYIPVRYQLLYVNFFCLLDSCFLSWVEQQQDAAWKKWFKSLLASEEKGGHGG